MVFFYVSMRSTENEQECMISFSIVKSYPILLKNPGNIKN